MRSQTEASGLWTGNRRVAAVETSMAADAIKALLIENDANDARMIQEALATAGGAAVEWGRVR